MKLRIRFSKEGVMKYIGHLDLMRFFQKAIRRAEINITYSQGFSPHQVMSFAHPLAVGITSRGEYIDISVDKDEELDKIKSKLNKQMVDGLNILSVISLPDNAKKAMASVYAADYQVNLSKELLEKIDQNSVSDFLNQEEISIIKKSKKKDSLINIKDMIIKMDLDGSFLNLRLATGSSKNLKVDLLMDALFEFLQVDSTAYAYSIHRLDLLDSKFVSLEEG